MVEPGCIRRIISLGEGNNEKEYQPIVRVVEVKKLTSAGSDSVRYRLMLDDSREQIPCMVATQNNEMLTSGAVDTNTLLQLCNYTLNSLGGKQVIILLSFNVAGVSSSSLPQPPPQITAQPLAAQPGPYPSTSRPPASYAAAPQSNYGGGYGASANSRPVVREEMDTNIMPIASLNPYTNRWTIKARITSKSDMRRWSNAKGEGTLFNIDLLDAQGGEIRGTFFKDSAEKWFPVLELHKVYTFSGGLLKVADRKFSTLKSDYEITFNASSEIRPVLGEDTSAIKTVQYHFVKIRDLATSALNASVDVLCVVKSASECSELVSQKLGGKILYKRDLTVYDDSGYECRLTLWGDKAQMDAPWGEQPILALKSARVGEYNGKNLSSGQNTNIEINPDLPAAAELWKYKNNSANEFTSLSTGGSMGGASDSFERRKLISSIKDESMGTGDKPDYITVKASVNFIKHDKDCWYTACPTEGCNKKVIEVLNNNWSCERCNKEFPKCDRRFIMSITLTDHSGQNWFSLFNDTAQQLVGRSADELHEMKMNGNEAQVEEIFQEALFKSYVVKARVKQESVNDEMRVKSTIVSLQPVNFVQESKSILDAIAKYN